MLWYSAFSLPADVFVCGDAELRDGLAARQAAHLRVAGEATSQEDLVHGPRTPSRSADGNRADPALVRRDRRGGAGAGRGGVRFGRPRRSGPGRVGGPAVVCKPSVRRSARPAGAWRARRTLAGAPSPAINPAFIADCSRLFAFRPVLHQRAIRSARSPVRPSRNIARWSISSKRSGCQIGRPRRRAARARMSASAARSAGSST